MKKKITNRLWGAVFILQIALYAFGVGGLLIFFDDILWNIISVVFFFGMGSIPLLFLLSKKGRNSFVRGLFSCYYITDDILYRAAGKRVYFSIKKEDISQIGIDTMNLGMYGSAKKLVVLSKDNRISDVPVSAFARSNKILAELPYRRKKLLEEWWGRPIMKYNEDKEFQK